MKMKTIFFPALIILLIVSCKNDDDTKDFGLDQELEQTLNMASNGIGKSHFLLPKASDFSKIPQDPKNEITQAKVELGAMLYHETGLALNPRKEDHTGQYSCASCHFASAGFQAGRHQGISDGGLGFGINGEGREPDPAYDFSDLDVQPIRTPAALNVAYQEAMLWNGQFGATGVNAGTEAQWTEETPKAVNHLGYQGVETQAIAGLDVHRFLLSEQIVSDLGYTFLFDKAFPEVDQKERYDREHAGLAIAAYERTLLASEAPFQQWLHGQRNALSEEEKRGAVLFFGKANCSSCHNGVQPRQYGFSCHRHEGPPRKPSHHLWNRCSIGCQSGQV